MLNIENKRELDALVSMIDEPNDDIFTQIRHKVIAYGEEALPVLEEAWVNNLGDNESSRIESLIDEIRVNELEVNLKEWVDEGSISLFKGYMIVMHYLVPGFDEEKYNSLFDRIVKEVWLEINEDLTALEKVKVLNHVFYIVHNFKNNVIPPIIPEDFYCSTLFDKHKGNSFSLGILYQSVSQTLGIPVFGVDLPGNFISVYMDDNTAIKKSDSYSGDDVLFYINPANVGNVFTHNEVKHYCGQMDLKLKPKYFMPATNATVLTLFMKELETVFHENDNTEKAEGLLKAIAALQR